MYTVVVLGMAKLSSISRCPDLRSSIVCFLSYIDLGYEKLQSKVY